jgi:hypothetical protein
MHLHRDHDNGIVRKGLAHVDRGTRRSHSDGEQDDDSSRPQGPFDSADAFGRNFGKKRVTLSECWTMLDAFMDTDLVKASVALEIQVIAAQGLVPLRGCKRACPYLRFYKKGVPGYRKKTSVKVRDLDPVWKERLYFLGLPGDEFVVEAIDDSVEISHLTTAVMGRGAFVLSERLINALQPGPATQMIDLYQGGAEAGRVELQIGLVDSARTTLHEFHEITPGPPQRMYHHLQPHISKLRVKLQSSRVLPYGHSSTADPYIKVCCGLFEAETEPQMATLDPVWDEDFIIPVPFRTIGNNPFPKAVRVSEVEIQLWQWEAMTANILVAKVRIPFAEIAGMDGEFVDPDDPPWMTYAMSPAGVREQVRARIHPGAKSATTGALRAAVFFDTSYDDPRSPPCGTFTLQFDHLHLQDPDPEAEVKLLVHYMRHWVILPVHSQGGKLERAFEIALSQPQMLMTIAVVRGGLLRHKEKTLGVLHFRPSHLIPGSWCRDELELLTRGKGHCDSHGTLALSVRWDAIPFHALVGRYLRPPLAPRYYRHPWTPAQAAAFSHTTTRIITAYLDAQPHSISPDVVQNALGHEFNKFDTQVLKAHFSRVRRAFFAMKAIGEAARDLCHWRRPEVTVAANVAWALFSFWPREVFTLILVLVIIYLATSLLFSRSSGRLPRMDAELFGGMAQGTLGGGQSGSETQHLPQIHNPIAMLQHKIEKFEESTCRAQLLSSRVAGLGEMFLAALHLSDYVITKIVLSALILLLFVISYVPFPLIMLAAGLYALRHPRFRKPVPSKLLCLLSCLPDDLDTVIYTKTGS